MPGSALARVYGGTVAAVKGWLIDVITKMVDSELAGVAVSYGPPGNALKDEHVWVNGTASGTIQWGPMGNESRAEDYELVGYVETQGPDQRQVTERAWAIYAALDRRLRLDAQAIQANDQVPGLLDVAVGWAPPSPHEWQVPDVGCKCLIEFRVRARTYI